MRMPNPEATPTALEEIRTEAEARSRDQQASTVFSSSMGLVLDSAAYVGELFSLNYEEAVVVIHDYEQQNAGGLPANCFLVGTRLRPGSQPDDLLDEDTSLVLLRVMDHARLPSDSDREAAIERVIQRESSGEPDAHWDDALRMDVHSAMEFGFHGIQCKVVGTLYFSEGPAGGEDEEVTLRCRFGGDLSNFYGCQGLKVHKLLGDGLEWVVNFRDPVATDDRHTAPVSIGTVRYASANRAHTASQTDSVQVSMIPADLLATKTAVFGMTRMGKSNTTKILIESVFRLRLLTEEQGRQSVGQLVFDLNGEYANENEQDGTNPTCVKLIGRSIHGEHEGAVRTWGLDQHPNDPNRELLQFDFHNRDNFGLAQEMIESLNDDVPQYLSGVIEADVGEAPDGSGRGAINRADRRSLVFHTILFKARLVPTAAVTPSAYHNSGRSLFSVELRNLMSTDDRAAEYRAAAQTLDPNNRPSWNEMSQAITSLAHFTREQDFKDWNSANQWLDQDLSRLLDALQQRGLRHKVGVLSAYHDATATGRFTERIYDQLCEGDLVIVDQSIGDEEFNRRLSESVMREVFNRQRDRFRHGETEIPEILVYVEEAHNLVPADAATAESLRNIWVRTAKEGAKYHIGMVYATQEPTSIHSSILKNTANWFLAHLNNRDEAGALSKYYDFEDFRASILRGADKGFLRMRTLTSPFTVSVQVRKFELQLDESEGAAEGGHPPERGGRA